MFYAHRLVAEYFIDNPNNYPVVNHKDGDKLNNNVTNLEWASYSENTTHAHKNNLIKMNNSTAYRRNAFDYYPHKCAICGWDEDVRILEVHHIDENHDNNELNNLMILCPICHKKLTLHLYKLENNNL